MRYEESGGILAVPPDVVDRICGLAQRAHTQRDGAAARELAALAESYEAVVVAGYSVVWWRNFATLCDEVAAAPARASITLRIPDPTAGMSHHPHPPTTGEPVSTPPKDVTYPGACPADLRVEYRLNGDVRFRIRPLVGPEAVVDIPDARVDDLVDDLHRRGEPRETRDPR